MFRHLQIWLNAEWESAALENIWVIGALIKLEIRKSDIDGMLNIHLIRHMLKYKLRYRINHKYRYILTPSIFVL